MRFGDDEVGCEHGRGDLVTVRAVADERAQEAGPLDWLTVIVSLPTREPSEMHMSETAARNEVRLTNSSCTAPQ